MRSAWIRVGVLCAAVAAAVWAVAANWDEVRDACRHMPLWVLFFALASSFMYVACTMFSWRAIINADKSLKPEVASRIFYSSQVAKYLPGGVWNFVAAAQVGRDYNISRRRSVTSLLISVAISIVTGLMLGSFALIFSSPEVASRYRWVFLAFPVGIVMLTPPVLNRLVSGILTMMRREALEVPMTWRAALQASAWAGLAWLMAGTQLFVMLTSLGMSASPHTFVRAVGGYALGWTVGFLVVFVPAGVGVREVALAAVLAGMVSTGALVVVLLLSRVMTTIADVVLGVGASLKMRGDRS